MAERPKPLNVQYEVPTTVLQAENGSVNMFVVTTAEAYLKNDADAYIADLEKQLEDKDRTIAELRQRFKEYMIPPEYHRNPDPKLYGENL